MGKEAEQSYTRYAVANGSEYEAIGQTADVLPSGYYNPSYDEYYSKAKFVKKDIVMPRLYVLPNEIQKGILDDIVKFWKSEDKYRRFGNVYKRNILLYSQPGNGKTSLINILANILIREHNGVVVCIDSPKDLLSYAPCMKRLHSIEPNRKVITIIEDFERLAEDKELTAMLLQLLDGNNQLDNVVTIATTNYPEILEKRFTCRPSRFNVVIEYKKPTEEMRRAYITNKLSDAGMDVSACQDDIERLVGKTDGYTFDFLKEAVQGIYVDGIEEHMVFERLNKIKDKEGKIRIEEDVKGEIGFKPSRLHSGNDCPNSIGSEGPDIELPRPRKIVRGLSRSRQ